MRERSVRSGDVRPCPEAADHDTHLWRAPLVLIACPGSPPQDLAERFSRAPLISEEAS